MLKRIEVWCFCGLTDPLLTMSNVNTFVFLTMSTLAKIHQEMEALIHVALEKNHEAAGCQER